MSDQKTTIRVSESTKQRLKKHGDMGMSYDDVVNKILDRLQELEEKNEAYDE